MNIYLFYVYELAFELIQISVKTLKIRCDFIYPFCVISLLYADIRSTLESEKESMSAIRNLLSYYLKLLCTHLSHAKFTDI